MRVLVTRPAKQAGEFVALLKSTGHVAHELPCIEIKPLKVVKGFLEPSHYDVVIFTSSNAVENSYEALALPWSLSSTAVLGIGPATVSALKDRGQSVTEEPVAPFNSEQLIRSKTLSKKNLQKLAVIKGVGGRDLLQNALLEKGISVDFFDVYGRIRPIYKDEHLQTVFLKSSVDIVTITSNEMLQNLVGIAGKRFNDQLINLPLVVSSKRAAALAKDLGFRNHVIVASAPGDRNMLNAINSWTRSQGGR